MPENGTFRRPLYYEMDWTIVLSCPSRTMPIRGMMEGGPHTHIERRVERVQFETDRHLIVGNVTLPPEGYQSRFSDSLNRPDVAFIPVVDVEIRPLEGGEAIHRDFIVVGKDHVRVAFPIEEIA